MPDDWNIGSLRKALTETVPNDLVQFGMRVAGWMPFPPAQVADITDDDILFLKKSLNIHQAERYSRWPSVYARLNINVFHCLQDSSLDAAQDALFEPPFSAVPKAPLVFLIGEAFLVEHEKWSTQWPDVAKEDDSGNPAHEVEPKGLKQTGLDELRRRKEELVETATRAKVLVRTIGKLDEVIKRPPCEFDLLGTTRQWIEDHDFHGLLAAFRETVESDYKESLRLQELVLAPLVERLPNSGKTTDKSDRIYQVFDAIVALVGDARGRGAKGDKQATVSLLGHWGINLTEDSAKHWRARQTKR
jgi:hypothetical protein